MQLIIITRLLVTPDCSEMNNDKKNIIRGVNTISIILYYYK